MYAFFIFPPYNISFASISKIIISLWVRPLDSLLGLRPWTPLGDFRPPGMAKIPSPLRQSIPQVTEPLTPLDVGHSG